MILEKILLGITLAAPIGPVSIEMMNRGLKKGFWAAYIVRLGGVIGNILCLVLAHYSLSSLMTYPLIINSISLVGTLFLIYLGLKNIFKKEINLAIHNQALNNLEKNGLVVGFVLALANPVSIVFWLGIFAASLNSGMDHSFGANLFIIAGVLIWGAFLSAILAIANRFLNPKVILFITKIAGGALIYFGLKYGWDILIKIF